MSIKMERAAQKQGEAVLEAASNETDIPPHELQGTGQSLLLQALSRENMQRAWKRVKANKGSAGVDGLSIEQTGQYLKRAWPEIKRQLLSDTYKPAPVKRIGIPKADGSIRELGIPTVVDRLIQQALLQVLQPVIDPTFSNHSHGFRPGRKAHDAIVNAQRHVQEGYQVVVDVDLSKFFDRVNHDILMNRVQKRIGEARIVRLIRSYLNAGIMLNGVVTDREQGTPQGSPLSPLLANILLDEIDQELEQRGHRFERYADDCNVYVRSWKAGQRVMNWLNRRYEKLHLKINEDKSAVASVYGRRFLGYHLWKAPKGEVRRAVSKRGLADFKQRIRQMTRRKGGRSMVEVIGRLRSYMVGWKGYFKLAQTPKIFKKLDEWIRHRLRAIQLKHWRRGKTIYKELLALGASEHVAQRVAANSHCWWRNSQGEIHRVLTISWFDRLGLPRLS